jgi:hypothetical protein
MMWFMLGAAIGGLGVLTQWWTVNRIQAGRPGWTLAWAGGSAVTRMVLTAGLLFVAFRQGLAPGLACLAAWWLARWLALGRVLGEK